MAPEDGATAPTANDFIRRHQLSSTSTILQNIQHSPKKKW
jgi:hypothetical protein